MINIVDNSHFIQYNDEKTHNELLKAINATVNHELRNPLNSIVIFNEQTKWLGEKLIEIIGDQRMPQPEKNIQMTLILQKLLNGNKV